MNATSPTTPHEVDALAASAAHSVELAPTRALARLASIDVLRGLVIVIMALDHVRAYFTDVRFDPLDPVSIRSDSMDLRASIGADVRALRVGVAREPFFSGLNADIAADLDLRAVIDWHRTRGAVATMVLRDDPQAARFGLIDIDQQQRVRRILGQPATAPGPLTSLMFASVHVFEPDVFAYMKPERFGIIKATYPALLAADCPVYGYRFDGGGRTVVVSGDTRASDAVVRACNGCDVLVHEVYSAERFVKREPEWQRYHAAAHTSTRELAKLAARARPKLLVLYHQLFWGTDDAGLLREIRAAGYQGRVVSAKDLGRY